MANGPQGLSWDFLVSRIRERRCIPFLGAGASHPTLPMAGEIARRWAEQFGFPLPDPDRSDLTRVSQFMAVTRDPMWPKEELASTVDRATAPDFKQLDEPHGLLADLSLPVYLTTNYDDFMTRALESRGRHPRQELCRWNRHVKRHPSAFDPAAGFKPDFANPVVFHLHGHAKVYKSMVLTEDDYLEFLVSISRDPRLLPPPIQEAITESSLLFLGYRIADWNFRVLFQTLVGYLEKNFFRRHVSVQLVPVDDTMSEEQTEKIRRYLDKYYEGLRIQVYWGTCSDFVTELRRRWEEANHAG